MQNAVIYARYSSDRQREVSIEDQVRECQEYAKRHNLAIIKCYADKAVTGRVDDRKDFQLMIKDAAKKKFQIVLSYKNDRFARNRFDAIFYKHKLKTEFGVTFIAIKEPIPDGPGGIIMESLYESMAEMYSTNLAENVNRGMTGNALKCIANNRPPFGYMIDPITRHYVIDPIKGKLVTKIFRMAAAGTSNKDILAYASNQGYKYKNMWVHSILKNERYRGLYIWRDIRVEGGMPALVDIKTFEKVQKLIATRRLTPRTKSVKYLLSCKLFCGICGTRMNGEYAINKVGNIYRYYNCNAHKKGLCKKKSCPG